MTYKTILVHLDSSARCAERVEIACRLAHDFDAHLVGLYVTELPELPGVFFTAPGPELIVRWEELQRRQAAQASELFHERVARAGLDRVEIRHAEGDAVAALALHARYADLLVLGQSDPDAAVERPYARRDLPDETVLAAARPVLLVPFVGSYPHLATHVLVAWDASLPAARSVTAALPLLKRAKRVTVLVVNADRTGRHGDVPGADIALYLARHGVQATVQDDRLGDLGVADWLLSRAFDLGADLIVMGAYGHSLSRERLFGGVTRSVLGQMTVPVLLEH